MGKHFPVVRSGHGKGKFHMVAAAPGTSDLDGSLYGFYTLCGKQMTEDTGSQTSKWQEVDVTEPLPYSQCCHKCWHTLSLGDIALAPVTSN